MILATTLAICLCLILALAIIWRLMMAGGGGTRERCGRERQRSAARPQGPSHVPAIVGGLIGIVLCQAAWLLVTNQAPTPDTSLNPNTPAKLVEAERQAREKDIATVTGHLDDLSKKLSAAQAELSQARHDIGQSRDDIGKLATVQKAIGEAVDRTDATINQIADTLSKHDTRLKALEKPPLPYTPRLTLNRLQVRPVQLRGHPAALALFPQTIGSTVQFASIDFCPPPAGSGECTPAPNTPPIAPNCTHSLICDGHGTYVTIPPAVAPNTGPLCIRLTYILEDQTQGVAPGGPIEPRAGAIWQRNPKAPNQCDQASPNQ
jgi:hypothetical protein